MIKNFFWSDFSKYHNWSNLIRNDNIYNHFSHTDEVYGLDYVQMQLYKWYPECALWVIGRTLLNN